MKGLKNPIQTQVFVLSVLGSCALAVKEEEGPGEITSVDPCGTYEPTSTEFNLIRAIDPCFSHVGQECDPTSACVSAAISNITANLDCEPDQHHSSCSSNQAAAAFILVETFRKIVEHSVKADSKSKSCGLQNGILATLLLCAPPGVEQMFPDPTLDPTLVAGYDNLVRKVSTSVGREGPIAEEISQIHQKKLWHGALTLALTFIAPGIIAVLSPAHFRTVALIQIIGVGLVFFYVLSTHGLLLAVGAVSISLLVILVQLCFLVLKTSRDMQKKDL